MRKAVWVLLAMVWAAACGGAEAQEPALAPQIERALVTFDGQPMFEVRGDSALPAVERVGLIRGRLRAAAEDPAFDPAALAMTPGAEGIRIGTSDHFLLNVFAADARLEDVSPEVLAASIVSRVQQAIVDYRAARTPDGVRRALLRGAGLTAIFLGGMVGLILVARLADRTIARHVQTRLAVWEARSLNVLRLNDVWRFIRKAIDVGFLLLGALATYLWLSAVLLTLPWTRDAGRTALQIVAEPVRTIARGILSAVPDLIALALIAVLTLGVLRALARFFDMLGRGHIRIQGFDRDWATPTRRLVRLLVVLFAAIMAYPYIPGSSSEAFKAIGIFAGLMLSLGATSIVANLVAGQSLIYRRAFRIGDRIAVAGVTGDVEELTAQATYIRTLKNERVTVPNAVVLASEVTNYSQFARGDGLILHTEVGIGYETPWAEVEAMLLEAARRTPGALTAPPPFVLQKSLGDYSPIYELNLHTRDEKAMQATYSALHANIQDVFAERGVQIMTPHYVGDPAEAKIPPRGAA